MSAFILTGGTELEFRRLEKEWGLDKGRIEAGSNEEVQGGETGRMEEEEAEA